MVAVRRLIFPIPFDSSAGSHSLFSRACRVHGVGVRETSGTGSALFVLHNGAGTADPAALPFTLAANESARDWFGESGIWFDGGLFLENLLQNYAGCVFISELASDVYADTDIGQLVKGAY